MRTVFLAATLAAATAAGADSITIHVKAEQRIAPYRPIFAYFGYDEPNNTYTTNGRKLLGELAALNRTPVYVRTHFLLATGNGSSELKFGSTNAYTEDAAGRPVYDWTIIDRIFDTWLRAGVKPFVEIGFTPQALSTSPGNYHSAWFPGIPSGQYFAGWAWPPRDYAKWARLVSQWVQHEVDKYGKAEVASWYWEVWNEPDIPYWHGTAAEYDQLYDYTTAAVKQALPAARVGGPASTGPAGAKAAAFLRQFLEHCAHETNAATHSTGAPLDFITFHAKGRAAMVNGHVQLDISQHARDVDEGFRVVSSFEQFRSLPIILSESDPEGCAACPARVYPQNAYRNGPIYPAFTATTMSNAMELSARHGVNLQGVLTWAFEFEDQPLFAGLRALATNGVDMPVLNLFRMYGLMRGDRVAVESSGAIPVRSMLRDGVHEASDVDALAVRSGQEVSVLLWNYRDDDMPAEPARVQLVVTGIPGERVLIRHYRIDNTHSDAYTVWKNMGSPQRPTEEQYAALEDAGRLQQLQSPRWADSRDGRTELSFPLPVEALSLVQISWSD